MPAAKPAADGLLMCCEKLGVSPHMCVYVGDSPSDGKAARAAGMHSVGVLWGAHREDSLVDYFDTLVSDIRGLGEAIRLALNPED